MRVSPKAAGHAQPRGAGGWEGSAKRVQQRLRQVHWSRLDPLAASPLGGRALVPLSCQWAPLPTLAVLLPRTVRHRDERQRGAVVQYHVAAVPQAVPEHRLQGQVGCTSSNQLSCAGEQAAGACGVCRRQPSSTLITDLFVYCLQGCWNRNQDEPSSPCRTCCPSSELLVACRRGQLEAVGAGKQRGSQLALRSMCRYQASSSL